MNCFGWWQILHPRQDDLCSCFLVRCGRWWNSILIHTSLSCNHHDSVVSLLYVYYEFKVHVLHVLLSRTFGFLRPHQNFMGSIKTSKKFTKILLIWIQNYSLHAKRRRNKKKHLNVQMGTWGGSVDFEVDGVDVTLFGVKHPTRLRW